MTDEEHTEAQQDSEDKPVEELIGEDVVDSFAETWPDEDE